jgi:hypothetical protein
MFFTGIDQHRLSSVLTTVTEAGERLAQVTLANDRRLLTQYFDQFRGDHQAVVEATGRWYWLRDLLVPQGIDLHLAHAKFLKAIAYAKVKTDAVDSTTLAQLPPDGAGGQGTRPECVPRAQRGGGLQPAVQRHAAHAAEAGTVAPSGKPLRLTEFRQELQRLIGKPDGHAEVRIWDGVPAITLRALNRPRRCAPNGVWPPPAGGPR